MFMITFDTVFTVDLTLLINLGVLDLLLLVYGIVSLAFLCHYLPLKPFKDVHIRCHLSENFSSNIAVLKIE
jgi:hypothetical protein